MRASLDEMGAFEKLFVWDGDKIEDTKFWCEPALTSSALKDLPKLFDLQEIDGFCALEARGFILAGMAAALYEKPVMLARKHKGFYDKMAHSKIEYTNWKGEPEALTLLRKVNPSLGRVLIIDDILDTGASLRAVAELLGREGIGIVGAYYLLDASVSAMTGIKFPIVSAVKHHLL